MGSGAIREGVQRITSPPPSGYFYFISFLFQGFRSLLDMGSRHDRASPLPLHRYFFSIYFLFFVLWSVCSQRNVFPFRLINNKPVFRH